MINARISIAFLRPDYSWMIVIAGLREMRLNDPVATDSV
jgi:hypothetical protein